MPAPDEADKGTLAAEGPAHPGKAARLRVCLVTTEFHGLFRNGGIGTANTGLALALAKADFDVTVAFADSDENGPRVKIGNFVELQETYGRLGITLDFVPPSSLITKAFDDGRSASYCVYLYLKRHQFDVVYFNDCGGHAFYSLLAKHVGVFHHAPRMYVVAHGPQEWVLELNSQLYWDRWPIITAYIERRSAELADALISPSRYLVDWMISHGWVMPANVQVIQNIVRLPDSVAVSARSAKTTAITEIVFFGRLEVRKGLEVFCDSIDLLNQSADLANVKITFMGKFSHVAGLHSGFYVVERSGRWRSTSRILCNYGQEEALHYLNRPGVLAVIPSLAENSPCVVAECLQLGVPFVATDRGGTAELVVPEDRDLCLVGLDPQALATRLEQILKSGYRRARPAISQADILPKWLRVTESGMEDVDSPSAVLSDAPGSGAAAQPLVSVCLAFAGGSFATEALIESILLQKYPRLEVILLDNGSGGQRWVSTLEAFEPARERMALRVVPGTPGDRAAARNAAAAHASGEYLLFVEEDAVILMPDCVEAFVAAALRTGADVVTGVPLQFQRDGSAAEGRRGRLGYFPIGPCLELGGFENCFGGGAFLVGQRGFEQRGGFETPCDRAIEDWLFLATSVLSGLRLEVVPEPLFWHRVQGPVAINRSKGVDNHRRILEAYGGQEIRIFTHIIERLLDIDRSNQERLNDVLASLSKDAREIALRVSTTLEPNHPDALRGLIQFYLNRQQPQEAFDFALQNDRSLLASAVGILDTLALEAIRRHPMDFLHEVSLSEHVRLRVKSVTAFPAEDFVRPSGGIAAHSIRTGLTILKAAAVCPPGTRSVRVAVSTEGSGLGSVFLAVILSASNARLQVSEKDLISNAAFWWSGWVPADEEGGTLELSVPVSEPTEQLLDLHFLCRAGEDCTGLRGRVVWETATAAVAVKGAISASVVAMPELATPIPLQVLDQGVLLTDSSDFPFPVFNPGYPTLLHPLPGRVALVRVAGAIPRGAKGLRSIVSIERAEAHPVEFAVWIRASSSPATTESEFVEADASSGWFPVSDHFRRHNFTVILREPADEAMDLYLATRVVEFDDVHYCHAVWHELLILE